MIHKSSILFILALGAAACGNTPQTAGTTETPASPVTQVQLTPQQLQQAGIETGTAQRRPMRGVLLVSGTVDVAPQGMVAGSFPLGGYVKSTQLLPGMPVRKGDVLAVLEDPQYIQLLQDYLTAKAKLQYAEAEFKRQETLQTGQAGSAKALQQAQADFTAQKVSVKALAEKLLLVGINPAALDENTLSRSVALRAPIGGFVSLVRVHTGQYVNPSDVLFELVNPAEVHLNLNVFEKDVPALRSGQRIEAFTNDRPGQVHAGKVFLVGRNINAERAVEVHCHFDRYDSGLLPGMFMNARVEITREDALAVPESAVVRWENRFFVFVEKSENGRFDMTEIQPGITEQGYMQISPVNGTDLSGARLALTNAYTLLMQLKNTAEEE